MTIVPHYMYGLEICGKKFDAENQALIEELKKIFADILSKFRANIRLREMCILILFRITEGLCAKGLILTQAELRILKTRILGKVFCTYTKELSVMRNVALIIWKK